MKLIIPVNEAAEGESVTLMRVDLGDVSERTAKKKFRVVLKEWGIPVRYHNRLIKEYFPHKRSGKNVVKHQTSES